MGSNAEMQVLNIWGFEKTTPHLIFDIYTEKYGINVLQLREAIKFTKPVKVSNRVSFVEGVINYRGNFIMVFDFRKICGLGAPVYDNDTSIIVVEVNGKELGLIVDRIDDLIEIPETAILTEFDHMYRKQFDLLSGMFAAEDSSIFILDLKKVLSYYESMVNNYDSMVAKSQAG